MPKFTLLRSQLLYGVQKATQNIFNEAKRKFKLTIPQSITRQYVEGLEEQRLTKYTYSSVIQCIFCQRVAASCKIELCSLRPDIKKRELKAFLHATNYDKSSHFRYWLYDLQGDIDAHILLSIHKFATLPREALNGLVLEPVQLKAHNYTFDKLRCPDCQKCMGYLFQSVKDPNQKPSDIITQIAFMDPQNIKVIDQLCRSALPIAQSSQISSIPVRIDAAWYNMELAYTSVPVVAEKIRVHLENQNREIKYFRDKIQSKVNAKFNDEKGLQM